MTDHHAMRINELKGRIESLLAEMSAEFAEEDDAHANVLDLLDLARKVLAVAAPLAGQISTKPVPFSKNTAREMGKMFADLALLGNRDIDPA